MDLMCMNSRCKHYFEDMCMKSVNEDRIVLDYQGICTHFEWGKHEGYKVDEKESEVNG